METARLLKRRPWGIAGAVLLLAVIAIAALSPVITPYQYNQIDIRSRLEPPGAGHILGTDDLGRDVFSRLLYGTRPYVQGGLVATGMATVLGLLLGFLSAGFGGRTDSILRRAVLVPALLAGVAILVTLVEWAIPSSFVSFFGFLMTSASVVGPPVSVTVVVPALLSLILLPSVYDLARNAYLSAGIVRRLPDVQPVRQDPTFSLRALGHSLRPLAPLTVVNLGVAVGMAVLVVAPLSYYGLGVPPPFPCWGNMLSSTGLRELDAAPWILVSPGIAIGLTTLGAIVFGLALREVWFPRFSRLFRSPKVSHIPPMERHCS